MTEETKKLLAEIAAAKKGRTNLKSLDETLGKIAMDFVQDRVSDLPKWRMTSTGIMIQDGGAEFAVDKAGFTERGFRWMYYGGEGSDYRIDWAHLRFAAPWIAPEFANRFPSRRVRVDVYQGPGQPSRTDTVIALPIPILIEWFRFLWPKPTEWGPKAAKYLYGHTTTRIRMQPGVGAKLRIVEHPTIASGTIVEVYSLGNHGRGFGVLFPFGGKELIAPMTVSGIWEVIE